MIDLDCIVSKPEWIIAAEQLMSIYFTDTTRSTKSFYYYHLYPLLTDDASPWRNESDTGAVSQLHSCISANQRVKSALKDSAISPLGFQPHGSWTKKVKQETWQACSQWAVGATRAMFHAALAHLSAVYSTWVIHPLCCDCLKRNPAAKMPTN